MVFALLAVAGDKIAEQRRLRLAQECGDLATLQAGEHGGPSLRTFLMSISGIWDMSQCDFVHPALGAGPGRVLIKGKGILFPAPM